MAVSELHTAIGRLGNECALSNWAYTTDMDGPVPDLPTDADRQALVQLLEGRVPTLEEQRVFESGYREGLVRARESAVEPKGQNAIALKELRDVLVKYWVLLPAEGTPERREADKLIAKAAVELKERIADLLPKPVPVAA